jgi:hypothetical protein
MHDAMVKILELLIKLKTLLTHKKDNRTSLLYKGKIKGTKYFPNMLQYGGVLCRPKATGISGK